MVTFRYVYVNRDEIIQHKLWDWMLPNNKIREQKVNLFTDTANYGLISLTLFTPEISLSDQNIPGTDFCYLLFWL